MKISVVTIFPQMLEGFLGLSMMKRAAAMGAVAFHPVDLRDFTEDRHRTTDDRPFGGGPGMVMKPEPIFKAVESIRSTSPARVILMCPQGRPFNQAAARRLSGEQHLVFLCGQYEGIDERVREALVDEEISIGDYVLTNGTLAAAVLIDAVVRLLPGVVGAEGGTEEESFSQNLLEFPQYTRPAEFQGMKVPEVLLSGDHAAIEAWRREQSLCRTRTRRPDLLGGPVEES